MGLLHSSNPKIIPVIKTEQPRNNQMDAVKVIKGYNKVNYHPESQSPPSRKRLKAAIAISAVLFMTLVVGLMLAAFIHESRTEQPESDDSSSSLSSNSADSIKTVCSVTGYPDSCFASISSLNASIVPDPEIIFKLSLQVTVSELSNISALVRSLSYVHPEAALDDCVGQLGDALSRLNDSLSEMEAGPGEQMLTERKVNDIRTWVSAGMTDEDSCLDGLQEVGSTAVDEVNSKMQKSKELMSNSLAIITNIHALLEKFGLTMH